MSGGGTRCVICKLGGLLAVIGALNWGLVGLFQVDLVAKLLGEMAMNRGGRPSKTPGLVGLGGIITLLSACKCCPCTKGSCETK